MPVRRPAAVAAITAACLLAGTILTLGWLGRGTAADIAEHHARVARAAQAHPPRVSTPQAMAALPEPVRRYFAFVFPDGVPAVAQAEIAMQGQFRRPRSEGFAPTSARQSVATATPALMFDATTPLLGVLWARAYDAYVDGRMEMKAKLLSALTVVDEGSWSSPALDLISLRRWLLEAPTYPVALLPGGAVRWEAVDDRRARATATLGALDASMVATFADDGRLLSMDAEVDGDLDTPFHGSGERAERSDYQRVQGMMIPMAFRIARSAGGQHFPFWEGRITSVRYR